MADRKRLSFAKIEFHDLQNLVQIDELFDDSVFDDWFQFDYRLNQEEEQFLMTLIEENRRYVDSFSEEELKAQIIIPLINKVNFFHKGVRGWYERPLKGVINHVLLQGNPDYMVASGIETPQRPYFFIQEYKKELGDRHPKNPLLAEMMVALELSQDTLMRGAFIIGRTWNFLILKKLDVNQYTYFRSLDLSVLNLKDLKTIYVNLHAIKAIATTSAL
ncbi:hypothetical protein KFU94_35075 [Chloroflexi bacterium TSY]|nr:hypothetical protein [Chloroflexi bacterium TSY]